MFNTRIKKNNLKKIKFQLPPPRLDLPPEESTDLEELEQFAKMFKQKRIKLGNNLHNLHNLTLIFLQGAAVVAHLLGHLNSF